MFERGYKAWCERYSSDIRKKVRVSSKGPLDPMILASHLAIKVYEPKDIHGLSEKSLNILNRNNKNTKSCWSAVTIVVGVKILVILNSSHSRGRQASDLMHELAHRILQHRTHETDMSTEGIMLLSGYDKQQEDEADWLSATLLLPRSALVYIKRSKILDEKAAEEYGVSARMLKYRMSMTGINRQFT